MKRKGDIVEQTLCSTLPAILRIGPRPDESREMIPTHLPKRVGHSRAPMQNAGFDMDMSGANY